MALAAVLLAVVSTFLAPGAVAAVHTVGAGESISAVLRRVEPGDTVRLTGAEYHENLVIEVPIVLSGGGRAVIRGGYEGHVIQVTAPGTVIEGLGVSESGPHLTKDMACILVEADDVTIRDSRITESLHGIYVKGGNGVEIRDNRIEGRLDLQEADRGNGIHLWNSEHGRIIGNEIHNTRDGIYFSFAHHTSVERNHVHHVRYGLHYMYSNHNTFIDNSFESNVAGAALMYSEDITFERNFFGRCRGFRAYGILLQSMDGVVARSNLILDNSRGIFLNNANDNFVENNDLVKNDLAIQLNGGCTGNRFVRNNFLDNLSQLLLDVSDRNTEWADEGGGNHWSAYEGYDLDGDGIGDQPFRIQNVFQVMESKVPEVRFYLLSPAARILELAENTLPILRLGGAEDPRPLIRPLPNDEVPWQVAGGAATGASPVWAGLYLLGSLLPAGLLLRLSRLPPRRRSPERSSGSEA